MLLSIICVVEMNVSGWWQRQIPWNTNGVGTRGVKQNTSYCIGECLPGLVL